MYNLLYQLVHFFTGWGLEPDEAQSTCANPEEGFLLIPNERLMAEISFSLAISWGEYEKVEELLSTPDSYNLATNEALIHAAKNGHLEIVDKLLTFPKVYNRASIRNNEALRVAVKYGHVEIVTKLLNIPAVRNGIHRYDKEQNLLISETNRPVSYHQ